MKGEVLANTTSLGMQPDVDISPLPAAALPGFQLAFDAIYTPVQTRLLKVSPMMIDTSATVLLGLACWRGCAHADAHAFGTVEPAALFMFSVWCMLKGLSCAGRCSSRLHHC